MNTAAWYFIDANVLNTDVRDLYQQSYYDADTEAFLENCYAKSDALFTQIYHNAMRFLLGFFLSMTSVNAFLNRGSMFVCSHAQYLDLLQVPSSFRAKRWIDLGAGDGRPTESLIQHFDESFATEQSPTMRWRLQERGFRVLELDKWQEQSYDLITAMNLIDRIDQPNQLLRDIRSALAPDGLVLLAIVLPYRPCYENGTSFGAPSEELSITGSSIEEQVNSLVADVLRPAGFALLRWTRVPYLCEGDLHRDFFRLNDIVMVLRRAAIELDA